MQTNDLPDFVEWDGDLAFGPPYELNGTSMSVFLLRADWRALRALCDRYLNRVLAGGNVRYVPLAGLVGLVFAHVARGPSLAPGDYDKGYLIEHEAAFAVPVVRCRLDGGRLAAEEISAFMPYIWVDSGPAMIGGRETYGFPKQWSEVVLPRDPRAAARFSVATLVIPAYDRSAVAKLLPLLDASRTDGGVLGELAATFTTVRDTVDELLSRIGRELFDGGDHLPLPTWPLVRSLLTSLEQGEVTLTFLKQFRAVEDTRKACYQAIVEAPARVTSLRAAGWMPGDWRIRIRDYASHRVVEQLGLGGNELASALHVWLDFDFRLDLGTTIAERSIGR